MPKVEPSGIPSASFRVVPASSGEDPARPGPGRGGRGGRGTPALQFHVGQLVKRPGRRADLLDLAPRLVRSLEELDRFVNHRHLARARWRFRDRAGRHPGAGRARWSYRLCRAARWLPSRAVPPWKAPRRWGLIARWPGRRGGFLDWSGGRLRRSAATGRRPPPWDGPRRIRPGLVNIKNGRARQSGPRQRSPRRRARSGESYPAAGWERASAASMVSTIMPCKRRPQSCQIELCLCSCAHAHLIAVDHEQSSRSRITSKMLTGKYRPG